MTLDAYSDLARAVNEAGFFTNGVQDYGTWQRTCVCSKRDANGKLTWNSFWASHLRECWYLGTWGGFVYRIPENKRVASLCISWLLRKPDKTEWDFDDQIKEKFGMVQLTDEEFEELKRME